MKFGVATVATQIWHSDEPIDAREPSCSPPEVIAYRLVPGDLGRCLTANRLKAMSRSSAINLFDKLARERFRFLTDEYGFEPSNVLENVDQYSWRLRYQNGTWFISPDYDDAEKVINVFFGNDHYVEEPFSLHMFMAIAHPKTYYRLGHAILPSESDIGALLELYSIGLRKYGHKILTCNESVLDQMNRARTWGDGLCPSYGQQWGSFRIRSRFA